MKQVYLNNASAAYPLAPGVIEAINKSLNEPARISGRDVSTNEDSIKLCRRKIASLLGVTEEQISLVPNATYGLNTIFHGLGLEQDELVITSVMEHNSVLRPLGKFENDRSIRVRYIPLDQELKLDENVYETLLREKPRLVVLTHASNVTGRINDIKTMFRKAKSAGALTVLDASQTVGRIPVKAKELFADMVVFPGYKGLRASLGCGVFYIDPSVMLNQTYTGGTGIKSDLLLHPVEMPLRFEAGTPNVQAFSGLNAALDFHSANFDKITKKEDELKKLLYQGLSAIEGVNILDPDYAESLPVVSFTVTGMEAESVGFALTEGFGIECRTGLHCAPLMHEALGVSGTIRFSPSFSNEADEIEYALSAIREIISEK